jgi:hypothetical protein
MVANVSPAKIRHKFVLKGNIKQPEQSSHSDLLYKCSSQSV